MQSKFTPRSFSPISIPGLSNKSREAVNAALDAMSSWRNETADASEKSGREVVEKMAEAAKALGWPEQVVETARTQIQAVAEVQIKTMDQIMDTWEEQLKLPDPTTASPSAMLSKLKSSPSLAPGDLQIANPMQVWLQFLEQSQKSWAEAMALWATTEKPK